MERSYREILAQIGDNPEREGLQRTPARAAEAMRFLTRGYQEDVDALLEGAVFEEAHDDLVLVRNIEFYSMCEHHLLPFFGQAHVAYLPQGRIIGLSKIGVPVRPGGASVRFLALTMWIGKTHQGVFRVVQTCKSSIRARFSKRPGIPGVIRLKPSRSRGGRPSGSSGGGRPLYL